MEHWYVAGLKAGRDNLYTAQRGLARHGLNFHSPSMQVFTPRSDKPHAMRMKLEPMFAGYIFVELDSDNFCTTKIERIPGISHLIRSGQTIAPIRDNVMTGILSLPVCRIENGKRKEVIIDSALNENLEKIITQTAPSERLAKLLAFIDAL